MFRLGHRLRLSLDPPYAEAEVWVEALNSHVIASRIGGLSAAFREADTPDAEVVALTALYAAVVAEARPTWDIVDHLGPIPPLAGGMLRMPTPLAMDIVASWMETLDPPPDPAGPDGGVPLPTVSDEDIARLLSSPV